MTSLAWLSLAQSVARSAASLAWLTLALFVAHSAATRVFPVDVVRGVNLGAFLIFEPWMALSEWQSMGGADCGLANAGPCASCSPSSEWDLVVELGQDKANAAFEQHWSSWLTQSDVDEMVKLNLNTVRLPIGAWIIEALVNQDEHWPQGGYKHLKRVLKMLKTAKLNVLLDFHAMLGTSASGMMFAGRCVNDSGVQFYTDANLQRAYQLTALFTTLLYVDADYSTTFGILALNEPKISGHQDAYAAYQQGFVQTLRATEYALGTSCDWPNFSLSKVFSGATPAKGSSLDVLADSMADANVKAALKAADPLISTFLSQQGLDDPWAAKKRRRKRSRWASTKRAMRRWLPDVVFVKRAHRDPDCVNGQVHFTSSNGSKETGKRTQCLSIGFMAQSWEGGAGQDPAKVANGPQFHEIHPYGYFSSLGDSPDAYLANACQCKPVNNAEGAAAGSIPVIASEFWLATTMAESGNSPDLQFYQQLGDAQKRTFETQGDGWIFWNGKLERKNQHLPWSNITGDAMRDYSLSVKTGLMHPDASKVWDEHVCDRFPSS